MNTAHRATGRATCDVRAAFWGGAASVLAPDWSGHQRSRPAGWPDPRGPSRSAELVRQGPVAVFAATDPAARAAAVAAWERSIETARAEENSASTRALRASTLGQVAALAFALSCLALAFFFALRQGEANWITWTALGALVGAQIWALRHRFAPSRLNTAPPETTGR